MKKILLPFFFCCCYGSTLTAQQLDHVQGDLLVQLQPDQNIRHLIAKFQHFDGRNSGLSIKKEISKPLHIWHLHADHTIINESGLLAALRRQPEVQAAQFNHFISARETVPNDPAFGQQWQWVNTGQTGGTPDADVDADLAWDLTTGGLTADGREIVVCVVEGANRNHPDLQGNIWFNTHELAANGIDDDGNGYVDDYNGWNIVGDNDVIPAESHGTTVAGMIGAKGNNGQLITGINWDVKIMNVTYGNTQEASVIEAYTYPLIMRRLYNQSNGTQGAFVVVTNSSWGIDNGNPAESPLWCAFYDSLGLSGVLSCGSTANNNVNIDVVGDLPTGCSSEFLVSVTATNDSDIRTFSGYGLTTVDVGAPGEDIVSLSQSGGPATSSGTSFASPLTAGIIGLLYSAPCSTIGAQALSDPAGTAMLVRDALFNGVDLKPNLAPEIKYGGRVNAYNSLLLLLANCGPCPKPYSIAITNVVDTTAAISWSSADSALQTNLLYRTAGDTVWTLVENVASPYIFSGLLACTVYEFQLGDVCSDTLSGFTASQFFQTDGCCEAPESVSITNIENNAAQVEWTPVLAANSYNVLLISSIDTVVFSLTEPLLILSNLGPCALYSVEVQTVCDTGLTEFTAPVAFTTAGCGACLDQPYCASFSENATEEWISNVTVGDISNTTGSDGGYGDYTSVSTDLETFQAYEISLTPGFAAQTYNEWFVVWIDFNQNGVFENDTELVYNENDASSDPAIGQIVIPGDALPGATRMRVSMWFDAEPGGPCIENFNYGEVEDYCINIVEGTPITCAIPSGLDTSAVSQTAAQISWNNAPEVIDYQVRYKQMNLVTWNEISVSGFAFSLTGLTACTGYEFQVRANCTGVQSDYSASFQFTTGCVLGASQQPRALAQARIFPNPFSRSLSCEFSLKNGAATILELFDAYGRKIISLEKDFPSGKNQAAFPELLTQALPSGLYVVRITSGGQSVSMKAVK